MSEIPEFTVDVITCDTPTARGRIYPRDVIEKALPAFKKLIKNECALGFIETKGGSGMVNIDNATHLITKAELKGSVLKARIRPLNQKYLSEYMESAYKNNRIKFYMRGLGTVNADRTVSHFEILSIDVGVTT